VFKGYFFDSSVRPVNDAQKVNVKDYENSQSSSSTKVNGASTGNNSGNQSFSKESEKA
jgi:hypothetical protein